MPTVFQPVTPLAAAAPQAPLRATPIDPRLSRTFYFDGRLLSAEDLIRDQQYLDQRLLDVGRSLGDGIVDGLQLDFNDPLLTLQPGVAVCASGRTLRVETAISVDLGDRTTLAVLNAAADATLAGGRLNSGLYAVALGAAEDGFGSAEVFPRDFGASRTLQFDAIREGVELLLVPLPLPDPPLQPLAARALLARTLVGAGALDQWLPSEAVALGVLAVADDAIRWCDPWLLRHPRRPDAVLDGFQEDLLAHYRALLAAVLSERAGASFHAGEHFHLLPPLGPLPKACIDPLRGLQTFFPAGVEVQIVPLREDDMEAALQSALSLPPLDLDQTLSAEVLVVAALAPAAYAELSTRLLAAAQNDAVAGEAVLEPSVSLDGEPDPTSPWNGLWENLAEDHVWYLRRPPRAAADGLAGIILAAGYQAPAPLPPPVVEPPVEPPAEPPAARPTIPLSLQVDGIARWRAAPAGREDAAEAVLKRIAIEQGENPPASMLELTAAVVAALMHISAQLDTALWPTLAELSPGGGETVLKWLEIHRQAEADGADVFKAAITACQELGLSDTVVKGWDQLG